MSDQAMPDDGPMAALVADVAEALLRRGWLLATAESCTGGLIATTCTDKAGSSQWFDMAVVSYSNEAKQDWLGVPAERIACDGAVSESVVRAMAEGVLQRSRAHVSVAVSGVAGPGGGTPDKPVGTVWVAWAVRETAASPRGAVASHARCFHFDGTRRQVRQQTCATALQELLHCLQHLTGEAGPELGALVRDGPG